MNAGGHTMREALRQMLAVLEEERQALAGLDIDAITIAAQDKVVLCDALSGANDDDALDEECRGMIAAARSLNETNRQIRNLVAANVSARLDALTGSPRLYAAGAYAVAGRGA